MENLKTYMNELNTYKNEEENTVYSNVDLELFYYNINRYNNAKNITLLNYNDYIEKTGTQIINNIGINYQNENNENICIHNLDANKKYKIYGHPEKWMLDNNQDYSNCGVIALLNVLYTYDKMTYSTKNEKELTEEILDAYLCKDVTVCRLGFNPTIANRGDFFNWFCFVIMFTMHNCKSFKPSININSKVLILGSMPGVKSLEEQEYYAHPQNRFWKVMAQICNVQNLQYLDYPKKLEILLDNNIALWDTIKTCNRNGSLDSDIQNETPNNIKSLLKKFPNIKVICLNGNKAYSAFKKYFPDLFEKYNCYKMPSTSPANAKYTLEKLIQEWDIIKNSN